MKIANSCIPDKDIRVFHLYLLISPMLSHTVPDKNHVNIMHWLYWKSTSSSDVGFLQPLRQKMTSLYAN